MPVSVDNVLPKRLPRDDRSAVRVTLRVLRAAGYVPHQFFDADDSTWVSIPSNITDATDMILGVDDAEVLFRGNYLGDSFWVRFVMGNEPTEVICDHSWRDDEVDVGWIAFDALNQLTNRWIELEG